MTSFAKHCKNDGDFTSDRHALAAGAVAGAAAAATAATPHPYQVRQKHIVILLSNNNVYICDF
jgi:hypothetical protein